MTNKKIKPKLSVEQIKNGLEKCKGNVTACAISLGCSRKQIYVWFQKHPELVEFREDCENEILDLAESKLAQEINKGNMTAIIFLLKTKGRKRGYVERVEQETSGQLKLSGAPVIQFDSKNGKK